MSVQILEEDVQKVYKVARELPSYQATVAAEDYHKLFAAIGISQSAEQLQTALDFSHKYQDGRVEIEQLLWFKLNGNNPLDLLEIAVEHLDSNSSGYIGVNDIKYTVETVSVHNAKLKEVFQAKNGEQFLTNNSKDGKISLDDFKKWLHKK